MPFHGDVLFKSQETYKPELILAIPGRQGSQERRKAERKGSGHVLHAKRRGLHCDATSSPSRTKLAISW